MVIFDLVRICRDPTSAVYAPADRRSRNHHNALSVRAWSLPCTIHSELAVPILFRGICRSYPLDCWHHSNDPLFRFFLDILYQVRRFLFLVSIHQRLFFPFISIHQRLFFFFIFHTCFRSLQNALMFPTVSPPPPPGFN